jgi:hypothetical protein
MQEYFPLTLASFLDEFCEYMRTYLMHDLEGAFKKRKGQYCKLKDLSKSQKLTKAKEELE